MTIEPEFNYSLATTPSTGSGGSHIQDASGLPAGGGCRMMMPRRRPQKTGGGMSAKSKVYSSFEDAVRDIPDGATLGFGGFAVVGMPINLYQAVARQGAKNLTCVSNSTRGGATLPADAPDMSGLIRNDQVKKVICAFTAPTRASQRLILTEYVEKGLIEAELVPQGTLAERMRAAGAGIPAFYTPAAVGTELAEGRETRVFNGREYLLELALPLDYAFIRAYQADASGNLRFRRSQRNFNPIMAMAARVTVVEVEQDILPVGAIDPDDVHTAGIFVHRLVKIPPPPEGWWPQRPGSVGR
jgi:3-oxoadipate CoA-transferase, alpha subunit